MIRVIEASYVSDYVVRLRFNDGAQGEVDLAGELYGEVFEPLRDKTLFAKVRLHPEIRTIAWPDGSRGWRCIFSLDICWHQQ